MTNSILWIQWSYWFVDAIARKCDLKQLLLPSRQRAYCAGGIATLRSRLHSVCFFVPFLSKEMPQAELLHIRCTSDQFKILF